MSCTHSPSQLIVLLHLPLLAVGTAADVPAGDLRSSPFGINTHARPVTIEVPHIRRLGAKWVRVHFAMWHDVEREKGTYRFTPAYDTYVKTYRDAGLHLLNILCYGNTLYCDSKANPQHPTNVAPRSEEALAAWGNYVEAVVRHYSALGVKHWEIWNEPTFDTFIGKGEKTQCYTRMLKVAYARAKQADPGAFIVGCSTGHVDLGFIEEVLKAGGGECLDAISVHPYNSAPEAYEMTEKLAAVAQLMKRYGINKPIWVTELGVATSHQSESAAADLLVRNIVLMRSCPEVERFFWYDFRDDGTNPDYTEHNLGLIKNEIADGICTPKRGFHAYRFAAEKMGSKRFLKEVPVGENDYARMFRGEDENVLVAWNTMSGMVALRGIPATATAQNIYGEFMPVERKGDLAFVKSSGSPVYVTFKGDPSHVSAPGNKGFVYVSPSEAAIMGPGEAFAKSVALKVTNPFPEAFGFELAAALPYGYIGDYERKSVTIQPGNTVTIPVMISAEHNNAVANGEVSFSLLSDRLGTFHNVGSVRMKYYRQRVVSNAPLRVRGALLSPSQLQVFLSEPATVSAGVFGPDGSRLSSLCQGKELSKGDHVIPVGSRPENGTIHITAARSAPVLLDTVKYVFSGLTRTLNACCVIGVDAKGFLYILSPGDDHATLYKVDDTLHARWSLRIPPDEYFQAMTCGDNDDLFIASWRKGRLLRVADISTDTPRLAWQKGLTRQPLELATDGHGKTFVASVVERSISCIDTDGELVPSFGAKGRLVFPPGKPMALSKQPASLVALDGVLYVGAQAARTITGYDAATGKPLGLVFGNEGGGMSLYGTNGIGPFATDGEFIFAAEYEMNRVSVYDKKGNFLTRWDSKTIGGVKYSGPWDAAVGPDGSLYVSCRSAGTIIRVLPRISVASVEVPCAIRHLE